MSIQKQQILINALQQIAKHAPPENEQQGAAFFVECQWRAVAALANIEQMDNKKVQEMRKIPHRK